MRRFLYALVFLCMTNSFVLAQRECISYRYQEQEIKNNPALVQQLQSIEKFIKNNRPEILSSTSSGGAAIPVIKIPVVVHLLYNKYDQNISDAQVISQIEVLNRDFRRINKDTANTPETFKSFTADCYIEFALAVIDPQGRGTTGIIHKPTAIQYFGMDDRIKFSNIGGDDAWDADKYFNIWVGNLAGGLVGYSSVLGGSKEKDGIVVRNSAFGTIGTVLAPYNEGRTATHEAGHWMGLRHIWGDQYCGNDEIDDTPPQQTATRGCPSGVVISCDNVAYGGNMYMNYMDFTNDACTNMFTEGQKERMRTLFLPEGPRHALLSSDGCTGTPIPETTPINNDSLGKRIINIYPNPAQDMVTVDISKIDGLLGKFITVHNYLGQQVLQARINNPYIILNIAHLKQGIYFIRVSDKKETYKLIRTSSRNQ